MRLTRFPTARIATALVGAAAVTSAVLVAPAGADDPPRAATSISIRAEAARVDPGQSTAVRGNLRIPDGEAAGREVSLEARPVGTTGFTPIGTATAGESGGLRLPVTPESTTRYRWYYAGADDARPRTSAVVQIRVATRTGNPERLLTTLSIRAVNPVAGERGTAIVGRLRSGRTELPNRRVQLVARPQGASWWRFVGQQRTGDEGQVRFAVHPRRPIAYRLTYLGSQVFRPSQSGIARVGIRPRVTIAASPRVVDPGGSTTVSGVVFRQGRRAEGVTVDLLARADRPGTRFHQAGTGITDAEGAVGFTTTPARDVRYRLRAENAEGRTIAVSRVIVVWVRTPSSLSVRGRDTADGFAVSGGLRGGGDPVAGALVALEALAPDASEYSEVDAARTGRGGGVVFRRESLPGTSYRLVFDGNRRFVSSTSGTVVD